MLEALTSSPETDAAALSLLAEAMSGLRKRLEAIAALPLEGQLRGLLRALSGFEGERLQALLDRLGWSGKRAITLEEAGKRLGITRERMRQLQEKVLNRLGGFSFPPYVPAIDLALDTLSRAGPIRPEVAAALLKEEGISNVEFAAQSVIAAARACGRNPPIQIQNVNNKSILTATAIPLADAILRLAYRQAHASGASNIAEVVAEMTSEVSPVTEADVRHILKEFSEARFLESDWFCHRPDNPGRDRLRNTTRRMLSVASPIELGVLREGIRREYRYRGRRGIKGWSLLVPPRSVLREYYRTHPEFVVDDDGEMVKTFQPLDYRNELGLTDTILVDTLRSSPACVLDRSILAAECARRSMNANTFNMYLTYSSVIVHLGTDVWSLRGVRVDPAAVAAVREANAQRPRERRVLDHGWSREGRLWLAARVPAAHDTGSWVVGIPAAIRHYVSQQEFEAVDEDGVAHGTIRVSDDGSAWGFGRFLRQRGADEGDILIAEFDLTQHVAALRLGDDELLEEMSPED
jgi:Sigma-70, region 4